MGFMAALLPYAGPILKGASAIVGGMGASKDASNQADIERYQASVAEYNAKVYDNEAKAEAARTIYESRRNAEAASRIGSELEAKLGASGAVMTEGAPLAVMGKQASESMLENELIGHNGQVLSANLRGRAKNERFQSQAHKMTASMYDAKSSNSMLGGVLGAAGALVPLTGFFTGGGIAGATGGMVGGQVGGLGGGSFGNAGGSDMTLGNTMLGTGLA